MITAMHHFALTFGVFPSALAAVGDDGDQLSSLDVSVDRFKSVLMLHCVVAVSVDSERHVRWSVVGVNDVSDCACRFISAFK